MKNLGVCLQVLGITPKYQNKTPQFNQCFKSNIWVYHFYQSYFSPFILLQLGYFYSINLFLFFHFILPTLSHGFLPHLHVPWKSLTKNLFYFSYISPQRDFIILPICRYSSSSPSKGKFSSFMNTESLHIYWFHNPNFSTSQWERIEKIVICKTCNLCNFPFSHRYFLFFDSMIYFHTFTVVHHFNFWKCGMILLDKVLIFIIIRSCPLVFSWSLQFKFFKIPCLLKMCESNN